MPRRLLACRQQVATKRQYSRPLVRIGGVIDIAMRKQDLVCTMGDRTRYRWRCERPAASWTVGCEERRWTYYCANAYALQITKRST